MMESKFSMSIEEASDYTGKYEYWQYTSSGTCSGINGYIDLDKCYNEYVDPRVIEIMKEKIAKYNETINQI